MCVCNCECACRPAEPSVNPLTSLCLSGIFRGGCSSSSTPLTLLTAFPPFSSLLLSPLILPLLIFPLVASTLAVCQLRLPCHHCSHCCCYPFFFFFSSSLFLLQLQFRQMLHGTLSNTKETNLPSLKTHLHFQLMFIFFQGLFQLQLLSLLPPTKLKEVVFTCVSLQVPSITQSCAQIWMKCVVWLSHNPTVSPSVCLTMPELTPPPGHVSHSSHSHTIALFADSRRFSANFIQLDILLFCVVLNICKHLKDILKCS